MLPELPESLRYLRDFSRRESREGRVTPKRLRPRCGARTRTGAPGQAPAVWDRAHNRPRNGRCRLHGGTSIGPTTPEGRERCREAGRRRWALARQREHEAE